MPWWVPAAMGGAQLVGSLIKSIDTGGPDIDAGRVLATRVNPFVQPAAVAGQESRDRIAGVQSEPLAEAMARQEAMRAQQERYLGDLRSLALGDRSLAQEQMQLEQQRLQQAIMGQRAGARGTYGQLGASRAAPMQASLIGARMVAPTQALMQQERDRAMQQYMQALANMGRQDELARMNRVQQQRAGREGLLQGEQRTQYGADQGVTAKKQEGEHALNEEMYG